MLEVLHWYPINTYYSSATLPSKGTLNHNKAINSLSAPPMINVAAEPILSKRSRPKNPPRNRTPTAIIFKSRFRTRRAQNRLGSAISSHHTVVSTTEKMGPGQRNCMIDWLMTRTCGRKLRVDSLAHDPLQTHTSAGKGHGSVTPWIGPYNASWETLTVLINPQKDSCKQGAQRLENCAEEKPTTRSWTHAITDSTQECPRKEAHNRNERMGINEGRTMCCVVCDWQVSSKRECKL